MSAGARVVIDVGLREDWPGDDAFDEWVRNVFRHRLEQLGAVATAEVVEWSRRPDDELEPTVA